MSEVIVHIGPHKTGTTAIQEFLSRHHEVLLGAGIDFPKLGRLERGTLGSQAHRYFSAYMRGATHEYPTGFEKACRAGISDADLCILSSEDFYFGSRKADIRRLLELVPGISRIVLFLRDPVAHARSMYGEALKGVYTGDLSSFYNDHLTRLLDPKAAFSYYNYEQNIRRWAGFAPVTEIVYDPSSNILEDFFAAIDPSFDLAAIGSPLSQMNVAAAPLVRALQLSLNRSLKAELLDRSLYRSLKKRLWHKGPGGLEELYGGQLVETVTDTKPFRDAFREGNPRLAFLCDNSPAKVTAWELPTALDAQLIANMIS